MRMRRAGLGGLCEPNGRSTNTAAWLPSGYPVATQPAQPSQPVSRAGLSNLTLSFKLIMNRLCLTATIGKEIASLLRRSKLISCPVFQNRGRYGRLYVFHFEDMLFEGTD